MSRFDSSRFGRASVLFTVPIVAGLALVSCHTVPMTSLPALSRVDPFSLNPDILRAVIVHRPTLTLPEGGTVLTLTLAKDDGSMTVREEFVLVPPSDTPDVPVPDGEMLTAFQISPADRGRFERFQTLLNARRAAKTKDNTFSLSITLEPCVSGGDSPAATAYIRANNDGRYIKIGRGDELLAKAGAEIEECA